MQATDNSPQHNTAINDNNGAMYLFVVSTKTPTVTSPQEPTTQGPELRNGFLTVELIPLFIAFLGVLSIRVRRK